MGLGFRLIECYSRLEGQSLSWRPGREVSELCLLGGCRVSQERNLAHGSQVLKHPGFRAGFRS